MSSLSQRVPKSSRRLFQLLLASSNKRSGASEKVAIVVVVLQLWVVRIHSEEFLLVAQESWVSLYLLANSECRLLLLVEILL